MVLSLLLVLAVAVAIAYPFFAASADDPTADPLAERERLLREKKVALLAIREAEADFSMGKLSEADYRELRSMYERRAAAALAALDRLEAKSARPGETSTGAPARFCRACGHRFEDNARFCSMCGEARGVLSGAGVSSSAGGHA